jgi:FixJ family two-component response regulator
VSHASTLTLVIIDNDDHIRRAVSRLLRRHGHTVHAFASAEAYLEDRRNADCVILDIDLPGMSGLQLSERLSREDRVMPVLFITAHDEYAAQAGVRGTGTLLLRKPLDEHMLLEAIARTIVDRS